MCQVMGYLMRRRLGSRAEAGIPKLLAHPTLVFLRLVLVCHCHAPRASRLGGWDPATTLCVAPLPRPAEWVAVRPLESQIAFPLWFPHVLFGGRYAGLAFVQGSIAREPVPGVTLNSRGRPLAIYPPHTSTSRPTLIIRRF